MRRAGIIGLSRAHCLRGAALCAWVACTVTPRVAGAQSSSSGNSVAAQALFDDAKRLVQQGDAASACPKFEESERLEPGIGTKLNLADCYERIGRSASAWILYLEVEDDTKHNGQVERQKMAHDRALALQPTLPRLIIDVPKGSRVEGLSIARDGVSVGDPQWGLGVPVDPGPHVVQASATGKKPWQTTIAIGGPGSSQTLSIPVLADAPTDAQSPGGGPAKPVRHTRRTAGFITMGVGGAGLILGSVFGLRAISKNNQSDSASDCNGDVCVKGGVGATARDDARSAGNVSTVAFAIGGAALATGLVLVLTDSKKEAPAAGQVSAGAFATRDGAEFSLRGAW
jgi:hypothetical protein